MKTQNDNATASVNTWSVINAVFGESAEFRSEMEYLRSPKRFKGMVKEVVAGMSQSESVTMWNDMLGAANMVQSKRIIELSEALEGVNLDAVEMPEPLDKDACEDERTQSRNDWNIYTLKGALDATYTAESVVHTMQELGQKGLRKALAVCVSAYGKGVRDNVIANSIVCGLSKVATPVNDDPRNDARNYGMALAELLSAAGFINLHSARTNEGRTEFVYSVNADVQELRRINKVVSARSTKLFNIEPVSGSIVIRSKYNYRQDVEPIADVIDSLNSVAISFKDGVTEDDIIEIARDAVEDEDGSKLFDAGWKQAIKNDYVSEFEIVKNSGNRFFIPRQTDGVGRIYEQSKFGFHQGHAHKELLELSNKEVLNEDGKWAMRQMIVELAGYRPEGKKPTEQEAEDFFYANESMFRDVKETCDMYAQYVSGEAIGTLIEVDAQTQGPGLYGLLTGDEMLCYNTAIIGNTERTDMYAILANAMNSRLSVTAWDRANCKTALMTKGYGAGYRTIMFGSGKDSSFNMDTGDYTIHSGSKKAVPLMETAETVGITNTQPVWSAFKKTMQIIAPAMLETQAMLSNIQEGLGQSVLSMTMPDGIVASIATQKTEESHAKWIDGKGKVHTMLHHTRVLDDSNKTALAPRLIQAVDAYILRQVARIMADKGIDFVAVHDGYMTHPNHTKTVMEAYRVVLAHVYEIDLMTDMLSQLLGREISSVRKNSTITVEDILASKYALWF